MTEALAVRQEDDLVARVSEGKLTTAEHALIHRLVRLRPGQKAPTQPELALMVAEAQHMGLDVFAGQAYFIRFRDDGPFECYPHWSGLIKIAQDTGQYEGHDGPWFSADGEKWVKAWAPDTPPRFAKVTVFRTGHRPCEAIAKWSRANKGSPIWKSDPENMLAKVAFRMALRRAFPREADRPLSPAQLKALQSIAASRGQARGERLAEASDVLGRPVESFKALSAAEASEIIDAWVEEETDGEVVEDVPGGHVDAGERLEAADAVSPARPPSTQDVAAGASAAGVPGDDLPGGEPWPDVPEGADGQAGAEALGEVTAAPAEPSKGWSTARDNFEDVITACAQRQRRAAAMSTVREFLVGLGGGFKGLSLDDGIEALSDGQLDELTALITTRFL